MVNGKTTYGRIVDTTLARLLGDERAGELGDETLVLLKQTNSFGGMRVIEEQLVRRSASLLLLAAGFVTRTRESDSDFLEITESGREALARMEC